MKNKFVIYTALTGDYDKIEQPAYIDNRFDYVLFSDSIKESRIGVWEVRTIPYKHNDLTRVSRYPKMHPEELLSEYEASLYHDANIQINSREIYTRFIQLYEDGIDWGGLKHQRRDCIFEEAYVIMGWLEREEVIFNLCHFLRQENYPRHNGMLENCIIYRRNNTIVQQVDELWWKLYLKYARRDQLTLGYVLWKTPQIKIGYVLNVNENIWETNRSVNAVKHSKKGSYHRNASVGFLAYARFRCRNGITEKTDQFFQFHYWLWGLPTLMAKVGLYLWGWYALVVYGPIVKYRAYKRHKQYRVEK